MPSAGREDALLLLLGVLPVEQPHLGTSPFIGPPNGGHLPEW